MAAEPLGIGVVGAGRICGAHAAAAAALIETQLVGVADTDPQRLAAAVDRFGCRGYVDAAAMLADPRVQAVVVGLPHWLHHPVSLQALRAGRHVLVEKPMAMTVAECDEMIAAADAAGVTLGVAHSQQHFQVNIAVREALRSGAIGRPVLATDTWYKAFFGEPRPPWFLEAERGGGMWPMNGSHMIDRLCFFLESPVVSVKARVGSPVFGMSATDTGAAFLQFENGVAGTIAHVGFREGVNRFEAEITGSEGQIRVCGDRGGGDRYWRAAGGGWEEVPVPPPDLPLRAGTELRAPFFAAQLLQFARAARDGGPLAADGRYGREIVRVLTACELSSESGREVAL